MRRLLNTLFVLSENGYLTVDGENVVVSRGKQEIGRIPMHTIESIRSFSYAGASPALMGACATRGIDVCFFSPRGRFLARVVGEERGNVLLRQQQYRIADDQNVSCCYARNFILGKVYMRDGYWKGQLGTIPSEFPWKRSSYVLVKWPASFPISGIVTIWNDCGDWKEKQHSNISACGII